MQSQKLKGIIPLMLTIYFLVQYIFNILSFQYDINLEPVNIIVFSFLFLYVLNKIKVFLGQNWFIYYIIYICFLISSLSFATFFAVRPDYSFVRILITCWLLFTMMIVFFYVIKQIHKNKGWEKSFTTSMMIILIIASVGQLTITEWSYAFRLSGGVNPNSMGYVALFCHFWFMYQIISGNHRRRSKYIIIIGWLFSLILIIWAMSRSIFLSMGIMYTGYIFFLIISATWKVKIKHILYTTTFGVVIIVVFNYIQNTIWYQLIVMRMTDNTNLVSRQSAWQVMLDNIEKNIWIGGAGWWNTGSSLIRFGADTDSPHNVYLRILSETGIIGLVPILILPVFIFIALLYFAFKINIIKYKKQMFIVASMILGMLAGLGFEDRYLTGYAGFNTGAIVWVMAMAVYLMYRVVFEFKDVENEKIVLEKMKKNRKRYRIVWSK